MVNEKYQELITAGVYETLKARDGEPNPTEVVNEAEQIIADTDRHLGVFGHLNAGERALVDKKVNSILDKVVDGRDGELTGTGLPTDQRGLREYFAQPEQLAALKEAAEHVRGG